MSTTKPPNAPQAVPPQAAPETGSSQNWVNRNGGIVAIIGFFITFCTLIYGYGRLDEKLNRLDKLEAKVDSFDARFDSLDKKLDGVSVRLAKNEDNVYLLRAAAGVPTFHL